MAAMQKAKGQGFIATGWTYDTEDGLHMEANKGEVDGIIRLTASVKGSHGERGFWRAGTVESWDKFLQAIPDIQAGLNDYAETSAAMAEIERSNAVRQSKLAKLEGSREFMDEKTFKDALAKLDKEYPKRSIEDVRKAKVTPSGEDVEPNTSEDSEA
jgi:hypothetical protein